MVVTAPPLESLGQRRTIHMLRESAWPSAPAFGSEREGRIPAAGSARMVPMRDVVTLVVERRPPERLRRSTPGFSARDISLLIVRRPIQL